MTRHTRRVWLALIALAFVPTIWLTHQLATLPDVAALARENPRTTAFIARYQGDHLAWQPVPLGQIAPQLVLAVLVSEDIGFFSHHGFELADLRDAVRDAVVKGAPPRGASTITQQLAKNLWLSPSRNPARKIKEALLTRRLERYLTKERILELYLNVVEFGSGVYGAEAAARHYFGRSAAALDNHQAARLAASLPRPSSWFPGSTSPGYLRQIARVEARMARTEFLRVRLGLPPADTAGLVPDSLLLLWDSLLVADSMLVPDSLLAPDSLGPDSIVPPDTVAVPDTIRPPGAKV